MKKKGVIIVIFIAFALIFLGSIVHFVNKKDDSTELSETKLNNINYPKSYSISLNKNLDFMLDAEAYNNDNKLNLIITSKKNYAYAQIEVIFYDKNNNEVNKLYFSNNFIVEKESIILNMDVDVSKVKKVVVNISTPEYDENVKYYPKNDIKFEINDYIYEYSGDTIVEIKAPNPYKSNLMYVKGYILFYDNKKLIHSELFQINDIKEGTDMAIAMNVKKIPKYDNIVVALAEVL